MRYEHRGAAAFKNFTGSILDIVMAIALCAASVIFIWYIAEKITEEKKNQIESYHSANIEYMKSGDYNYIYVTNENGELIELKVGSSYDFKALKVGDTIVYRMTEYYKTNKETGERTLQKIDYEY